MPIPFTRRWYEARAYRDILWKAVFTFDAQYKLVVLSKRSIATKDGINIRALGYLNGFIKSALDRRQLDIRSDEAYAVFEALYQTLWGKKVGRIYFEYFIDAMNGEIAVDKDELREGIELGTLDFLRSAQTGMQPTGWFSCF